MKKKHIICMLLALALCVALLPWAAMADSQEADAAVKVAGVSLTKEAPYYVNECTNALTYDELTDGAFNAHYDAENGVLTLQDLVIDNYNGNGIDASDGTLTLALKGTNSIRLYCTWNDTRNYNKGINADTLVIRGDGSLTFGMGSNQAFRGSCIRYGIYVDRLYMLSGRVTVEYSYDSGVWVSKELHISGGTLSVEGPGYYAFNTRSLLIAGGTLTGYTGASYSHGDDTDPCYAVMNEPEFSECGTYTIIAGSKKDGEDAVAVQQGESLKRYRYLRVTGSAVHTMADVEAAAPTCTEAGATAGRSCSVCGAVSVPQTAIPALGHTFTDTPSDRQASEATFEEPARFYVKCDVCGEVSDEITVSVGNRLYRDVAVTFDANGGMASTYSAVAESGKLAEMPGALREEHNFLGWFTQPDGGEQVTEETLLEGDCTLYAHWEEQPALRVGDVNGDGEVDNIDAALVYAYYNGKIDKFPVE